MPDERVKDVRFTEDTLAVDLLDGRTIIVPLVWYPSLLEASVEQPKTGRSAAQATASIGLTWTRTSAPRAFCAERPPQRNR